MLFVNKFRKDKFTKFFKKPKVYWAKDIFI
jgi:hypothetical protein